jgi:hypothetical protein
VRRRVGWQAPANPIAFRLSLDLQAGGGRDRRRWPSVDGGDDLAAVDALQVDGAPWSAMRKEMTDDNISFVPAGMPVLG